MSGELSDPPGALAESPWRAAWSSARPQLFPALLAGLGGFVAIFLLALVGASAQLALIIAPFGATAVLLFALPDSPLAQPRNVIGGHLISATIGLGCFSLLGHQPLSLALGVGLAIAAMRLTRTLHPPAGADPLVAITIGASWSFLLLPVLAGTVALVAISTAFRRTIGSASTAIVGAAIRRYASPTEAPMTTFRTINLFSYGTLQLESVQLSSFGRLLEGQGDAMPGFRQEMLEITDPEVIRTSGERFHPVVMPSDNPSDAVEGQVFRITPQELEAADRYEVSDYKRIEVTLRSGLRAFVYVKA